MNLRSLKIIFLFGLIASANSCKFPNAMEPLSVLPAPVLISPANNAVEINNPPVFIWRQSEGATNYTIQISTDSTFSTYDYNQNNIADTGKQVTGLNNLARYYWRVSAANSSATSGWSSPVWSFTTAGAIPNAPLLLSPDDKAVDISSSPSLIWSTSGGASGYRLQVASDNTFTNLILDSDGLTNTSSQVTGLENNRSYYWRVNAVNSYGTSDWSAPARSFTTASPVPDVPVLLSPADNSIDVSASPLLQWNASSRATSYKLQVSTDALFSNLVYNQNGIKSTGQQVTGLNNLTTFYWRVSGVSGNGSSDWSAPVWSFKTKAPVLTAPVLSLPTNNASFVSTSPTFVWGASAGAVSYTLQISTGNLFTDLAFSQEGITGTTYQAAGLTPFTKYYWRMRAVNSSGTSEWSAPVWSFTTGTAPLAPPVLKSPANNAANVSIKSTLSWEESPGAASYILQVSTNSSFTELVFNQNGIVNTSRQVGSLGYLTKYYWRVSAVNSTGTSGWSSPFFSFTTTEPCEGGTVSYGGKLYHTVQVGSQCWLKENLDVGIRITGNQNQTNNGIIEKFCYDNNTVNCNNFGGLYQWGEIMQYKTTQGAQGICPEGFHIPTMGELETLRSIVNGNSNALKAVGQGTGAGEGTNTSGFSALLGGYGYNNGNGVGYALLGFFSHVWSSTEADQIYAYYLNIHFNDTNLLTNFDWKLSGFSVRCLKD